MTGCADMAQPRVPRGSSRHTWQRPETGGSKLCRGRNWEAANISSQDPFPSVAARTHTAHVVTRVPMGQRWTRAGLAAVSFSGGLVLPRSSPPLPPPELPTPPAHASGCHMAPTNGTPCPRPLQVPGRLRPAGQGEAVLRPLACGSREDVPLGRTLRDDGRGLHSGSPVEGQCARGSDLS